MRYTANELLLFFVMTIVTAFFFGDWMQSTSAGLFVFQLLNLIILIQDE